ncbi:MAG TPA: SDR family NAD(P)-dependent oxidoreductase [Persephonella sp.]|nr:SDR family NAD(P)-dependent oxidoreductase [Hydrogenothermaceae bacterium]HIQ24949.1 SDR family NAD(P)-dependent oxidoreductase [Persephonella sp.]
MEKVAIITGASSGIGYALAKKFKKEGFKVINLSRRDCNISDINISVDLTSLEDISAALGNLLDKIDRVDVLVNNAGIGLYESWEDLNIEDLRYTFELNFFTPVILVKTLLPMLKETKGTIINVSSVAGKLYVPFMGPYCATKFALNAFSDSLRAELKPYKVHVLNLIIGRINTGFSKRALGTKITPSTPSLGATSDKLAEKTYKAYLKKKREIVYPFWYKYLISLAKFLPSTYDKVALEKWIGEYEN